MRRPSGDNAAPPSLPLNVTCVWAARSGELAAAVSVWRYRRAIVAMMAPTIRTRAGRRRSPVMSGVGGPRRKGRHIAAYRYFGDEAIAALRNRVDVFPISRLPERLSDHRHAAIECALLDEVVSPDLRHEALFVDQMTGVFDEHTENGKRLRCETQGASFAQEPVLRYIQSKRAEFVGRPGLAAH